MLQVVDRFGSANIGALVLKAKRAWTGAEEGAGVGGRGRGVSQPGHPAPPQQRPLHPGAPSNTTQSAPCLRLCAPSRAPCMYYRVGLDQEACLTRRRAQKRIGCRTGVPHLQENAPRGVRLCAPSRAPCVYCRSGVGQGLVQSDPRPCFWTWRGLIDSGVVVGPGGGSPLNPEPSTRNPQLLFFLLLFITLELTFE